MTEFLTNLAAISLGSSFAVLILMAAARLTRVRYAARWRCIAWLLLSLRLVVPVPLFPEQSAQQAPIQLTVPSIERPFLPQVAPSLSTPEFSDQSIPSQPASSSQIQQPPTSQPESTPVSPNSAPLSHLSLAHVLLGIWLFGAIGVLLWAVFSHLRFLRYLKRWATPVRDPDILASYNALGDRLHLNGRPQLLRCPNLPVPMLAGLLHPVLLLPCERMHDKDLEYALLHELTHYRRRDIWLKTLSLAAAAIHWFNPFIWLMRRAVERDTELSCDESALAVLPPEEHAAYGQTILNAVSQLKKA
ncbi:MAG: M56 family metallopeptidase [Lawsonibacter sp.]|jgi:beta-lactamase regulating signal transducer with metallopeptidase domain